MPREEGWCPCDRAQVSSADVFLEFSIAQQKLDPHVCSHQEYPSSCRGKGLVWGWAGL